MSPEVLVLTIIAAVIAAFIVIRRYRIHAEKARLDAAIRDHFQTLHLRYKRLTSPNPYGYVDRTRWHKEVDVFVRSTLGELHHLSKEYVIERISRTLKDEHHAFIDVSAMGPGEFEAYCADILRSKGWDVRVTGAAGDQGIDIIARKNGRKAVLQCKLHTAAVGNAAVQEAIAGRTFENADLAAVVTNSRFTRSAIELAHAAGVLLLHYTQLDQLDRSG